jgi:mannosyltransferase
MALDQAVLDPPTADEVDPWPVRMATTATVLAVLLVLFDLGDKGIWHDEAVSIGTVDRSFGDALWRIANWEVNQSPFHVLLAGWWRVGQGATFLRLLPAASTVLAVPALFVLGRRLLDARTGAIAALLLAVHPLAIQWGQQLRGYSLVLLLVILATDLLVRALQRPEARGPAVAWAAVAAAATYTHFFAALVVATCFLWLLLLRPLPRRLIVTGGAVYGLLLVPLGFFFVTRQGDPLSWVPGASRSVVAHTARVVLGGTFLSAAVYAVAAAAGAWALLTPCGPGRRTDRPGGRGAAHCRCSGRRRPCSRSWPRPSRSSRCSRGGS